MTLMDWKTFRIHLYEDSIKWYDDDSQKFERLSQDLIFFRSNLSLSGVYSALLI